MFSKKRFNPCVIGHRFLILTHRNIVREWFIYVWHKAEKPGLYVGKLEAILCCKVYGGVVAFYFGVCIRHIV